MRMIFFVRKYERPIESNPFSDLYWFWTGRGQLDLQTVANALGNTLAVTQRHYNLWSQLRQSAERGRAALLGKRPAAQNAGRDGEARADSVGF